MNDLTTKESTGLVPAMAGENALIAREVQSIQGAIVAAKKFPRDQGAALKRIEGACERTRLAEGAMYAYPRGKETITGPSIRLAEVIAQNWGNLDTGWRVLQQDVQQSTVQAWAWDMETNMRKAIEFTVQHLRATKSGTYALTDPRDIYEMIANNASRRQRNCILAIVPSDIVDAAIDRCENTLKNAGTIEEKRKKIVAAFAEFDISVEEIEGYIKKKIEALTSVDYVKMQKIWKSLKDGMAVKADYFEPTLDPEKIKRESDAAANDTKLPQEKAAMDAKTREALDIAIGDFMDTLGAAKAKGVDALKVLKMDPVEVVKLPVERIKAATKILREALK